ncbi:MAG: hypothetical protein JW753_05325 [Dehalococcoidia bacterium]|nr:hypothetical protein [Dehalococcoidia bacterium]
MERYLVLQTPLITAAEAPGFQGTVKITFPVTYQGNVPADALFRMSVYQDSSLLAQYEQTVHFDVGEYKQVAFDHTLNYQGSHHVGLEIFVSGEEEYSHKWKDVFAGSSGLAIGDMGSLVGMIMMLMMLAMVVPLMKGMAPTDKKA